MSVAYREFTGKLDRSSFIEFTGQLDDERDTAPGSSVLKAVLLENPATAIGEAALNFGTQMVSVPVSGLAGIGAAASNALGLTDTPAADVVHSVGSALTYEPRGEFGKGAAAIVAAPFQVLATGGQWVGDKTLDATDSPIAATTVDTAVNALPMLLGARGKGKAGKSARGADETSSPTSLSAPSAEIVPVPRGFVLLEEIPNAKSPKTIDARTERLAGDDQALYGTEAEGLAAVRRGGDHGLSPVDEQLSTIPGGYGAGADADPLAGQAEHSRELRARQLRMDDPASPGAAPAILQEGGDWRRSDDGRGGRQVAGAADAEFSVAPSQGRPATRESAGPIYVAADDVADFPGRDPTASRVGQTGWPVGFRSLASDESWVAHGASIESGAKPKTARYALVEADALRPSHDANLRPVEANPFGSQGASRAERAENEAAVQDIVRGFDPAYLGEAISDDTGAPIVARDGIVETGQRRAIALKRVYQARGQKAENYRQFLRDNADRFGITPESVDAMKQPVLVRVPDEPAPRMTNSDAAVRAQVGEAIAPDVLESRAARNPGDAYVGFRDQANVDGTRAARPIRRENILANFAKDLETTIYQGKVRGKKRAGFFRPATGEIRIKRTADLETAAHEVGHLLDTRIPEISNVWRTDPVIREELQAISYDRNSVKEGYAEGLRLYLTRPDALQAKAPKVFDWLERFSNSHPVGPALKKAQRGMVAWFEQDAISRAASKIGDPTSLKNRGPMGYMTDALEKARGSWRQSVVDDLDGIKRMEESLTGKLSPVGPYESARLSRAGYSIADGAIRYGAPRRLPDGSFRFEGKGLEEILRPVADDLDSALMYFVGRSSRELLAQGREHLFTPAEIDSMLKLRTPAREQAFKEYQAFNRQVLDFAQAHGIIDPASRALWQRSQYLPMHRVGQGEGFGAKPGDWSGIKALTGGDQNIREILTNITSNMASLINRAVKNEARQKIADLAGRNKEGGRFMVKIPAESRPVKVDRHQVVDGMLKAMGINRAEYAARGEALPKHVQKMIAALEKDLAKSPEAFEFMMGNQVPSGKNIVAVLREGKPEWYEVGDPLLYRALSSIDRPAQSMVVRWLGLPKRIGQATVTATFDFWARNFARDGIMASVMSRHGFVPVLDSMRGLRMRMLEDQTYRDAVANGMGMSSIYLDESAFKAKLERFYQQQGISYKTVLDTPRKLLNALNTMGDAIEIATRMGEFKRAVDAGENPRHAAYIGRELSTDFAMMGDSQAVRTAYDITMFLRPAVVSLDRLARGLTQDPNKGAIAAKAGLIALGSMALYLMNREDPRYADLPDWDKNSYWHLFVGSNHYRMPKTWEIGALGSMAERTLEKVLDQNPEGLRDQLAQILKQTFGFNLMPQIVSPFYEQATNKNSFTGAPIETPGMQDIQPFLRAKPYTSETMKAAGMATMNLPESMQVNPVRAEALLRGFFNTYAAYGLMLTDKAFFGDRMPEKRLDEMPVLKNFYRQEPAQHTRYEQEFYSFLDEAKRLRGTMKALDHAGRSDLADIKEQSPLAGEAKPLERAQKTLAAINKDMEDVRRDRVLTPDQKREKLDDLTMERNALFKTAVTESKASQQNKKTSPADITRRGLPTYLLNKGAVQ